MTEHKHEFVDPDTYGFEDVLVTEHLACSDEFCDDVKKIQWEVDFSSFQYDGEQVSQSKAKELWTKLCNSVGKTITVTGERHMSEAIEMTTASNKTFEFQYESDRSLTHIETQVNGGELSFDVSFYRELSR